jgi:aminoglycoside phosphotransferase (APT) family kinase protein
MAESETEQVAQGLRRLMERELRGAEELHIRGLQRISEGYSRENWIFEGSWRREGQRIELPLILRRDPVGSLLKTERRREFAVLQPLAASSLPVPEALWLDEEGELLGRPSMVMVRAEGECDWFVLNSERPLEHRLVVSQQLIELLAAIHHFDWRAVDLGRVLTDPGPRASLHELDHWEAQLRESQLEPHPELELVITCPPLNSPAASIWPSAARSASTSPRPCMTGAPVSFESWR